MLADDDVQIPGVPALRACEALSRQSDEDAKNFEIGGRTVRTPEMACRRNASHPAPLRLFVQLCSAFAAHREKAGS